MRRAQLLLGAVTLALPACGETQATVVSAPRYGIGMAPAQALIDSLDTDVDTLGHGLPAGRGSARQGAELFRAHCAACHGLKGEGMHPAYPALIGREPREGFPFATDFKLTKTIGNYWPHATTLYDYIRRAMPLTAPRSLSDDEVYSLTAYLLAANGVIAADATLDRASLLAVRMPARDRFVDDDRRGGQEIR
jgi:cytochrome c